ncbi:hypothetical protein HDZ31DRAFT_69906, partial [Schizophyllum fasciatum]
MHPQYCFSFPCTDVDCAADRELLVMFSGKVSRSVIEYLVEKSIETVDHVIGRNTGSNDLARA